jgi:hypothetical protein
MDIRLPVCEWVPYNSVSVYNLSVSSPVDAWNNEESRAAIILEVVLGVRENCRIAFNAAMVEEARGNTTLVPRSSILYLDAIVLYTLGVIYRLEWTNSNGRRFVLATDYHEQWQDALVYLRHIRTIHQTVYKLDDTVVQMFGGTPKYIPRVTMEK